MSDQKPYTPTEIDDTEDRMGSMEPLDFDQRRDERKGRIGDRAGRGNHRSFPPEREAEAGMTVGEVPGGETTMDDRRQRRRFRTMARAHPRTRPRRPGGSGSERGVRARDRRRRGPRRSRAGPLRPAGRQTLGRPRQGDEDTGLSGGDAVLREDDSVLSDDELEGDAPLDSGRDKRPGSDRAACRTERGLSP